MVKKTKKTVAPPPKVEPEISLTVLRLSPAERDALNSLVDVRSREARGTSDERISQTSVVRELLMKDPQYLIELRRINKVRGQRRKPKPAPEATEPAAEEATEGVAEGAE